MKSTSERGKIRHKFQSGFTLAETLVVVAVSVILMLAFFTIYDLHSQLYQHGQATVRSGNSARAILQAMDQTARQAHRIVPSHSIGGVDFVTSSTTVVLQLPAIDSSGEVVANTWDYVVYYASGNDFFSETDINAASRRAGGKKLLSDSLASVNFGYDNVDLSLAKQVSVDLQTRLWLRDKAVGSRLQQNMYLRNY